MSSGQHSQIINSSLNTPSGTWSGPDGTVHPMAFQNLLNGPFWFFPVLALGLSSSVVGSGVTYVGHETHNGLAVEHVTVVQSSAAAGMAVDALLIHLTQLDFYLDSTTLLPDALDFNIHPDDNALVDIPVEIRFGSYNAVNGAQVPFHVQQFINNSLALELQIQTVSLNTGITVAQIVGQ
jgi:hypothetical protein